MQLDDDGHLADVDAESVFAIKRPDAQLFTLYLIYSLAANVAFPIAFLPLYFRFKTLRYRFDQQGVSVSYGLFWRKETYLTYARIQDIHVSRNIFERWLGLGSVEIQTASGSSRAEEAIVGVREFHLIRNFLYARMRGHKLGLGPDATREKASTSAEMSMAQVEALLAGIRDELRGIREAVEANGHV